MTKTFTTEGTQQSGQNKSSFEIVYRLFDTVHSQWADKFEEKDDYLDATDDGEPSQESHGSPNKTKGGGELDLFVPLDLVEGGRVKVDLDKLQRGWWLLLS